jgi:hypothetical protein
MLFQHYAVGKLVVLNTKTDLAFRGVLWRKRGDCYVLRNAELISESGTERMDGELVVFAENLDFLQVGPFKDKAH